MLNRQELSVESRFSEQCNCLTNNARAMTRAYAQHLAAEVRKDESRGISCEWAAMKPLTALQVAVTDAVS